MECSARGTRYDADVLSSDTDKDIAILKIRQVDIRHVVPLSFRDDHRYSLGADVFTIGYPLSHLLGSSARFTKGSVSATSGLNDAPKQIQVSAEIQPGNSGGPLFDKDGLVVGVMETDAESPSSPFRDGRRAAAKRQLRNQERCGARLHTVGTARTRRAHFVQ